MESRAQVLFVLEFMCSGFVRVEESRATSQNIQIYGVQMVD